MSDPLRTLNKHNHRQWGSAFDEDAAEAGIYGVIKHMTDEPYSFDEYSYGRIPTTTARSSTTSSQQSTTRPRSHYDEKSKTQEESYDPHRYNAREHDAVLLKSPLSPLSSLEESDSSQISSILL
jgi:hypothetical protein